MIPEYGVQHIFTPEQLERLAADYEAKHAPPEKFRQRITEYAQMLERLLAMKAEWRQSSGIDALEAANHQAHRLEIDAWGNVLERLKSGKDVRPILRYLARENGIQEPWRLRAALRAVAGRKGRRK